jgi:hypothetical protein
VARIDLIPDEPAGDGVPADVAEELAERVVALVLDRPAAPTTQIPVQVVCGHRCRARGGRRSAASSSRKRQDGGAPALPGGGVGAPSTGQQPPSAPPLPQSPPTPPSPPQKASPVVWWAVTKLPG